MAKTKTQISVATNAEKALTGNDYHKCTREEKIQAGLLVNSTLTLVQLINKELDFNGE